MRHRGRAKGGGRAASRAQPSPLRVGLRYDLTLRHPECANVRFFKPALRLSRLTSLKPSMGHITARPFAYPWWLSNPYLQTLWPSLLRPRRPQVRKRVELGDDDFIDLSCVKGTQGPLVLVLHGLECSLDSHYGGILAAGGYCHLFMHLRGRSGTPNRPPPGLPLGGHGRPDERAQSLRGQLGKAPSAVVGYSLGGNLLLKYLGERRPPIPLRAVIAISVPSVTGHLN
jgi:predicted alpha/beta-fold hydrolase